MKNHFLIVLFILVISLSSVSADYHGTFTMSVGDSVSINIGNPPSFNVTNTTQQQTPPPSLGGGSPGGGVSTLSSIVTGVEENQTTGTPAGTTGGEEEIPSPEIASTGFLGLTGAAIGNFVKSGEGIATLLVLMTIVVAAIAVITVRKSRLAKAKNSEPKKE